MRFVVATLAPVALLMEFALPFVAVFGVMSGVGASCFRAWAVLTEKSAARLDRWTALGFFIGGFCAILFVFIDLGLEVILR